MSNVHRETAKIYTFPVKQDAVSRRLALQAQRVAQFASLSVPRTDFGSGWYHEAAIDDEAKPANH